MKPRKLVWNEGLFVTQHHFQQFDRYHEALLADRLHNALPFSWGVAEIEVDERALAAGQFKLDRLVALLPDGTPVAFGEHLPDTISPRSFDGIFLPQMRSFDVFVALPHEGETIANVDLDAKAGAVTRYVREEMSAADFNSGLGEQRLSTARANLQLLFGDERREAFDTLRVAQLVRSAAGAVIVRPSFIPPVLRIDASSFLMNALRRLLSALTSKQRSLAESRRQRTAAAVEFQASDTAKFWLLHTLNCAIPPIAHLLEAAVDSPELLYMELGRLIGALCTLAVEGDPTAVPKFNYLELGEVFEPMFDRAHKLLEAVIAEKYVEVPLTRREDGMYLGKVTDPTVFRYEFFLAASGMPEGQLRDRLPKLSKIASWNQIGTILHSAVSGLRLELEYTPPGALPIKPGIIFFKVLRTPEFWNDVAGTGTIAIYQPIDPQSQALKISLYAVDPSNLK
ncbi:MAG: type VI secretion system baseplate subunit TssK [Myxococcales bacterium]